MVAIDVVTAHFGSYFYIMPMNADLLKKLELQYGASTLVDMRYKGLDISIKTNDLGHPVLLFIGKRAADGAIKGERYVRTLIFDHAGRKIKDHWELKGKAS